MYFTDAKSGDLRSKRRAFSLSSRCDLKLLRTIKKPETEKKHIELWTWNQIESLDFSMNDLRWISTLLEHTSLECVPTNLTDVQH